MKHNYKNGLVALILALLMISAQGVEAHHPPKTKQSHRSYNEHYNPEIRVVTHHGHRSPHHQFRYGVYANYRVNAPVRIQIVYLPRGAHRIRTPHGFLYEYNGALYKKSERGPGFILVRPNSGKVHHRSH